MRPPLDAAAFAELYSAYGNGVFNYCLFHTGDAATAEDLAAETFARAWAARARYQAEKGAFDPWLFGIARRAVVDWHRQRTRHPLVALEAATPDDADTPETQVAERARLEQLRRLVGALPPAEQELIALKFGAGMTNRAMAQALGRSESAVGTALHKVMRKLRAETMVSDD